jgi:hypothetical protein
MMLCSPADRYFQSGGTSASIFKAEELLFYLKDGGSIFF